MLISSMGDILEKLKKIFKNIIGDEEVDLHKITLDSKIKEDLGLNSIGLLYLIVAIEKTFNISMHDKNIDEFITVGDVVKFIKANC